jgi:hypothetical protein
MTGCGSSRSRRATSTSTDSRAPLHPARRLHRPAAGRQRAGGRPRCRRPLRRGHARLRARDEAVGDLVRPVAGRGRGARRLPPPDLHDERGDPVRRPPVARGCRGGRAGSRRGDGELRPADPAGGAGHRRRARRAAGRRTGASARCSPRTRRSRSTSPPSTPRRAGPARARSSRPRRWARTRPRARPSARCARTSPPTRAPSGSRRPRASRWDAPASCARRSRATAYGWAEMP